MSYSKFVKKVSLPKAQMGVAGNVLSRYNGLYSKNNNYLPAVYQGPTNRVERYAIYDGMEQDPIISTSLDIIAEYTTQTDKNDPFQIEYNIQSDLPDTQTETIEKSLDKWIKLNDWRKRAFNTIRDIIKFGDIIFIRDPETYELNKCNIYDIVGVVADENKKPTHYIIRNVDLNVPLKMATSAKDDVTTKNLLNTLNGNFPGTVNNSTNQVQNTGNSVSNDPTSEMSVLPIDADNIVHLSLNIDNILLYPFGMSVLEPIYKTYIQKMLLQDCILMYRIKNAVEKTVFNIPVGNIPRNRRMQYMERLKNELSQRRMPSKDTDGIFNVIDVAYNSIPMNEDYWLPVDADGVQPKIEKLAGGQALGEINDMVFWDNQLIRGLKVPSSWVPFGPQDGQRAIPTNTSGTYVQEQRFFQYCKRLQQIVIDVLDKEFKKYLKYTGILVDDSAFRLAFYPPSSITEVTRNEIQSAKLNLCTSALSIPYISKQFALKHYLGLTEEEFNENQRLLVQEMQNILKNKQVQIPVVNNKAVPGLRNVNISNITQADIDNAASDLNAGMNSDMGMGGMAGGDMGSPDLGGGDMGGDTSGMAPAGGNNSSSGASSDPANGVDLTGMM